MARKGLATSALILCAVLAAHGQQPPTKSPTTFISEIELVEVDVSVLDKNRMPVRGLEARDFTVLEDGKPRPVVTFAAVDLPEPPPASSAWMTTVAPDVVANGVPSEGRLVVIMMDSSIVWENQRYARAIGGAIVHQLGPGDLGAVVYSTAFTTAASPQNFTTDRGRLLAAVNQPFFGMSTAPEMSPLGLVAGDPNSSERGADTCRSLVLENIAHLAESLGAMPHRRKVLFVVASRMTFQMAGPCSHELKIARERAFRAVDVANVTVHALDPAGLEYVEPKQRMALLQRQGDLNVLPERTGGRFIGNTNGQPNLVPAIFQESRSYYLLGFQPASSRNDGRFHSIDVRVGRRDTIVHARRGYYARSSRTASMPSDETRLPSALSGALPLNGIRMEISTAPVANGDNPAVAVIVAVRSESRAAQVEMLIAAFDARGQLAATARHDLALDDLNRDGQPSEIISGLTLKPGMYEVRAAVHERGTDRVGSIYTHVDVPDFTQAPLSLSGVVLAAQPAWPSAAAQTFGDLLPILPTTQRMFERSHEVSGFLAIHQGGTPQSVAMKMSITAADGRLLITDETSLDANHLRGTPAKADYRFRLPIAELPPGEYLLTIDAAAGDHTAKRDVRFRINARAR